MLMRELWSDVRFARRHGSTWRETLRFVWLGVLTRRMDAREERRTRNGFDPHT